MESPDIVEPMEAAFRLRRILQKLAFTKCPPLYLRKCWEELVMRPLICRSPALQTCACLGRQYPQFFVTYDLSDRFCRRRK
jgi:hypothetical protein